MWKYTWKWQIKPHPPLGGSCSVRAKEGWVGSARLPHPSKPLNFPFPTAQDRTRFNVRSFHLFLYCCCCCWLYRSVAQFSLSRASLYTLRPFFPLLLLGVFPSFQFATHNTAAVKITHTHDPLHTDWCGCLVHSSSFSFFEGFWWRQKWPFPNRPPWVGFFFISGNALASPYKLSLISLLSDLLSRSCCCRQKYEGND